MNSEQSMMIRRDGDKKLWIKPHLLAMVLAAPVLMTGCDSTSDVVDAVNPVNWFDSDSPETSDTEPKPIPGEDGPYPAIGAIPAAPAEPGIKREYLSLAEVLTADRANAQYTDEVIRRQSPPSRVSAAAQPVQPPSAPPSEPPTATSITPPPEAPSTVQAQPTPRPAPVPSAAPKPAPQPAPIPAPQPAPKPAPAQTASAPAQPAPAQPVPAQPVPSPAPAPEPLTAAPTPSAPAAPPPSQAAIAQSGGAVAAVPTRTQMIATIYFPNSGAGLTERDRGILQQVAQIYARDGGKRVVIVGHSSQAGASGAATDQALVNYKVSLDRAASVGQGLVNAGIPIDQIVVDARGANELKYSEDTPAGEAGNRRAEVFLQY